MDGETGVCWWTEPGHVPVYLIVDHGRVVACPAYAERWALGKTAGALLDRGRREGVTVEWIPLAEAPTLTLWHLVADKRPIRRWRCDPRPLPESHLTFGETGAGRWYVFDTREPHVWLYTEPEPAWAECGRRMRIGNWARVHTTFRDGVAVPVGEDPPLPDGLQDA